MLRIPQSIAITVLLVYLFLLTGCATPVGVNKVSPRESYQEANANPLNAGVLSNQSKYVLNRYALLEKFDEEPAAAIAVLHEKALHDTRGDILYTLAEGSYLYGSQLAASSKEEERHLAPDYFLLSALYSFWNTQYHARICHVSLFYWEAVGEEKELVGVDGDYLHVVFHSAVYNVQPLAGRLGRQLLQPPDCLCKANTVSEISAYAKPRGAKIIYQSHHPVFLHR